MIKLKPCFLLLFISQLTLTACTTTDTFNTSQNKANILSSDYLKDTQSDNINADIDPVLDSTRQAIAAHSDNICTTQYTQDPKVTEYKNLWLYLPELFQLSEINHPKIKKHKTWYLKHKSYLSKVSERAEPLSLIHI